MTGRDSDEGMQIDIGDDHKLTVNSADDKDLPGGWYQTTSRPKEPGETNADAKSTAVYDSEGNMPAGKGDNNRYE